MTSLTITEKRQLLQLARLALGNYLKSCVTIEPGALSEAQSELRAAFVTLRDRTSDRLLGCRGETHARRPLAASIIRHAIAAGTDDPRFAPVEYEALDSVSIHISALSPLVRIQPDEFELGRDGILILYGRTSGLLLPQVADRFRCRTRQAFLEAVCRKADLPESTWHQPETRLFRFETDSWGDDDDAQQ
jgi:AmmeMemoRadiSam system protein A